MSNDNLVLEHLRHIRAVVDETRLDAKELRTQVDSLLRTLLAIGSGGPRNK
jgi:hypothetical protein